MTCPHCCPCVPELEARVEALLDENHDLKVDVAHPLAVRQAVARQRHPSGQWDPSEGRCHPICAGRDDCVVGTTCLAARHHGDACPPFGMPRPKLKVVRS